MNHLVPFCPFIFLCNYPFCYYVDNSINQYVKEVQSIKRTNLLPTNLYKEAERRLEELDYYEKQLTQSLLGAPKGNLKIAKAGERIQYYLRENSYETCGKYISKSNKNVLTAYMQKRYNERLLTIVRQEKYSIKLFLQHSKVSNSKMKVVFSTDSVKKDINVSAFIQSLYSELPKEMKGLISPIDMSDRDYEKQWIEQPFITKDLGECPSMQKTERGEWVRSKSELNIANALYKYKIPYRYECRLHLNGGNVIYPDFTILDVRERKEKYWEHRGMMDDRNYAKHAVDRIKEYQANGIYLGDRLIITEETSTQILSTRDIEAVIKHYFCPQGR